MQTKIPQFQPRLENKDFESIKSCFDPVWMTEDPKPKELVEKLCKLIGAR